MTPTIDYDFLPESSLSDIVTNQPAVSGFVLEERALPDTMRALIQEQASRWRTMSEEYRRSEKRPGLFARVFGQK
jgi:hypothetical protein